MVGSSEVDGGNDGVGELSSARTTMAGVPQVFESMKAVQVMRSYV